MLGLVVICLALGGISVFVRRPRGHEHRRYESPDGRFQIAVFRVPTLLAMPGGGSDAPGRFYLLETHTGRVLGEQAVEMVQLVDQVTWSATNVQVGILADWSLPR
jgi:hypothetical protein